MTVVAFPEQERPVVIVEVTVVADPYPPGVPVHVVMVFADRMSVYVVVFHCVRYWVS